MRGRKDLQTKTMVLSVNTAVSCGQESWSFRQTWLMYLHVCDDGTLMFDEEIRQYGVGQYYAGSLALLHELTGFEEVSVRLHNDAGEHEIILRMTGCMTIDWFRFT